MVAPVVAQPAQLDTLKDIFVRLHSCWRPPPLSQAEPIDITVSVGGAAFPGHGSSPATLMRAADRAL